MLLGSQGCDKPRSLIQAEAALPRVGHSLGGRCCPQELSSSPGVSLPLSLITSTQGRAGDPPSRQPARHGGGGGGKQETPLALRDNPGNARSQEKSLTPSHALELPQQTRELQPPNQKWEKSSSFLHPCKAPPSLAGGTRGGARCAFISSSLKPSWASPSTSAVLLLLPLTCCAHRHSHPAQVLDSAVLDFSSASSSSILQSISIPTSSCCWTQQELEALQQPQPSHPAGNSGSGIQDA